HHRRHSGTILDISLSIIEARHLRLRSQRLDARSSTGVADIVRDIAAVQAQDSVAELLAVRVRTEGATAGDVEEARVQERSVVRTWAMRGTLHLLPSEDVRWVIRLIGPTMVRKFRRRHEELGLTPDVYDRAVEVMREALGEYGALTRRQIAEQWAEHGLPSEGQGVPHLLCRASLEGLICFGPTVGGQATHVLPDSWLGDGSDVADPGSELARRYVSAYAPTTPEDYGIWSGLPVKEVRSAFESIEDELLKVDVEGIPMWVPRTRAGFLDEAMSDESPTIKMLGAFDPYLLGYRTRELGVGPELLKRVHPGGGIIRPITLVDGCAIATWARKRSGRKLTITVSPFESLSGEVREGIDREVEDIGRFLGVEAVWEME
ncbi:MAG: winged helix DNA-binding domain-containing protein, partial [Dehalococcoidia bacterium]|nr:winged helix DNA-binding domain-containing protein [Dehalococcoidia bacterium]